ncbi:MAG: aminodeoxychorismate synthase, component I [Chromatiales bacterium]|nr:aminodeoxychorismate synthase, component I [Chromatiales bacterium]
MTRTDIEWPQNLAALHSLNPSRYPYLLESVADGSALGRYDLLFAYPQETLRLNSDFSLTGHAPGDSTDFLAAFDNWWSEESIPVMQNHAQPFTGGWFMLLGYELAQQIEPTLELQTRPDCPVAIASRVPIAIIRDHSERQAWIAAEAGYDVQVRHIMHDLDTLSVTPVRSCDSLESILLGELIEENSDNFIAAIRAAQRYIVAGDIFQANLSRQWRGNLRPGIQPIDIYERLRTSNPAPFAGLAVFDDLAVISSSPERLLRIGDDVVETRPIAGTRPRLSPGGDDIPKRSELLDNPKERAEHVMVIDLERNDLGRICRAGSVEVNEFMVVESYSHVHHIVSNIQGKLVEGMTPGTAIAAVFPGGSITGCPKVRCMEIIDELEGRPRGLYTGAMGYINRDGSGDLSILIRCITMIGNELSLLTGCGIVTDSVPEQELAEARAKAKGLIFALTQTDLSSCANQYE